MPWAYASHLFELCIYSDSTDVLASVVVSDIAWNFLYLIHKQLVCAVCTITGIKYQNVFIKFGCQAKTNPARPIYILVYTSLCVHPTSPLVILLLAQSRSTFSAVHGFFAILTVRRSFGVWKDQGYKSPFISTLVRDGSIVFCMWVRSLVLVMTAIVTHSQNLR